jgi:hypothetical protein
VIDGRARLDRLERAHLPPPIRRSKGPHACDREAVEEGLRILADLGALDGLEAGGVYRETVLQGVDADTLDAVLQRFQPVSASPGPSALEAPAEAPTWPERPPDAEIVQEDRPAVPGRREAERAAFDQRPSDPLEMSLQAFLAAVAVPDDYDDRGDR